MKKNNTKPLVVAIVGESGVGKDTAARMLSEYMNWNLVVSYTTRPMRKGEKQGREHRFVTEFPYMDHHFAITQYGRHHYWVNSEDVLPYPVSVYVVDEKGVEDLRHYERHDIIQLCLIKVTRSVEKRLDAGVSEDRMRRDQGRVGLNDSEFDFIIKNEKSMAALKHRVTTIGEKIKEWKG